MIGNTIAEWRAKRGITRAHLARRLGVHRSYITRLEQGRVQPGAETMFKVAAYFQAPLEAVFCWKPEEEGPRP